MKQKKQVLAKSLLALLLCVAMLVSTTFAWFTDSVVSGYNTIAAGNLDVELYHSNATVTNEKVTTSTLLFLDQKGNPILWEPGVVSYENLRVTNEGDLALIYQLALNTANENYILDNGAKYGLSQVLKVGVVKGGVTATDRAGVINSVDAADWTTLSAFLREGSLEADGEETWGIVIYWQPGDNDNNWNANNGKQLSSGDALSIDLGVKLTATQEQFEDDSFGSDYDAAAKDDVFPSFEGGTAGVPVTPDANGYTTEAVTITAGNITAYVPAGVKLGAGVNKLSLSVIELADSDANINLSGAENILSLDVHVEGVSEDNTTPITITLAGVAPTGLNMGNYSLYHVEGDATNKMTLVAIEDNFTAHNQFKYDPATGDINLYMDSFSEVSIVAYSHAWTGAADHSWYNADATQLYIANADQLWSFSQIVGGMAADIAQDSFAGKTITLTNNINLDDLVDGNNKVFYPICYTNSTGSYNKVSGGSVTSTVNSFEGTFDGNGHTIKNFYQNTWEMFGDYNDGYSGTPNHYDDAMGLFGYVVNGTIKNLTVENFSSDGEFTPTGVIAAYAVNSTFENIALVKCNPRVYNTGNGGIVGIGGNNDDPDSYKLTFTNITIDSTNKITALWGSWDVACGGLVGMFRGAGHAYMTNCHVGAQIDVYNDVCGNYQYYWYRYAGSLIGTNKNMITDENGYTVPETSKYHAENCTVHFGEWNNYYYCELVANSLASYTHDHQMSRLEQVKAVNGTEITYLDGSQKTVPSSGRYNYVVVNGNHATENATCYHFVDGQVWNHADAGTETVNGVEGVLKEDNQHIYLPFNQIFTGYGWGVKHIPIYDDESLNPFQGVTVLDRATADSVKKWDGNTIDTLYTYTTIKLGDLFKKTNGAAVPINLQSFVVSVTDVNANNPAPITAEIKYNRTDWTQTEIVLSGYGTAQITIQDYYFCLPTTIEVTVSNTMVPDIPDDLVINGDFENGLNSWSKHQQTVVNEKSSRTGLYGIQLLGDGSYGGMLNQTINNIEDGQTYILSFWYKVNNRGFNYKLSGVTTGTKYASNWLTAGSWTQIIVEFTANGDTSLFLNFNGGGEDASAEDEDVYIDDIILEKKKIVANGHFEYGNNKDWNLGANATFVNHDTYTGNFAVQISNPSPWAETVIQRPIAVKPNTEYKVSFWTKRESGSGFYYIVISQGQSPWTSFERVAGQYAWFNYSTNSGWVKHSITVNSGNFSNMMLKFTAQDANAGTILIDDVSVIELKESKFDGYIYNGDFEAGDTNWWDVYQNTEVTAGSAHSGDYGLKLTGNGGWGGMGNQDIKNLTPGQKYKVTLWVKVVAYGTNIGFSNATVDKENSTKQTWLHESVFAEWTELTYIFTATSNTVNMNFSGGGDEPEGGAVIYVDDIVVTELS